MKYLTFADLFESDSQPVFTLSLEELLQFGLMEDVIYAKSTREKTKILMDYIEGQLFTDILGRARVQDVDALARMVVYIAKNTGRDLSVRELAQVARINQRTAQRYSELLQDAGMVVLVPALIASAAGDNTNAANSSINSDGASSDKRSDFSNMAGGNRLAKNVGGKLKYYFTDVGIRNALMDDFRSPNERLDNGRLWENFIVQERLKILKDKIILGLVELNFWRNYSNQHIDYIEVHNPAAASTSAAADPPIRQINAYEIRWLPQQTLMLPKKFRSLYPEAKFRIVTPLDYADFLNT
ncbi:MAG: DUF4143 domain-containing protein, partial [Bifidobacteriaceae bacterium]|nr:DUF4143 domain-containing protein [Bifidobacteriaceae bacterium]